MTTIRTPAVSPARVFFAFLARDVHVVFRKQLGGLLGRVLVQPLLTVFVFSYVLPSISGGIGGTSGTVLAPGILANSMLFAGLLGVTVPLITELSYPKSIQDRLLTPVPVWAVGVERIVSGAVQSLFAAVLVLPIVTFLHAPGQAPDLSYSDWPLLVLMLLLGSVFSAALGLLLGSVVEPAQVNVLFSIIMIPLMMLGCVYYPWAALGSVRWLQIAVLANPVVYLSEALRAALTPDVPHLSAWVVLLVLLGGTAGVGWFGLRAFHRAVLG
ncbi:ABC transporter [Amycolatopsis mediterranei S699]|uniref:Transport permease protein n=2 Tax=Amycolatopsis mediterranei TaxID=33910 RepID=A0A0H3D852_AMYMU|nr:ABC transporter permease [Amycolatopsis mediterranei]ADJ47175.1 ABC-2 type transporter [Amycolatopsis mediterranei U32]AEK43998.1 ABC transporter [Amycolatopsis mediterranei S699]AFO78886.1 ABC transporter [Amycolatopsis mediterranei S699]AGT86014.1 ABC transporter [Amycolatopsis mediterranei RB]KDO04478.1 ABC transporter [Amycolatopsis mediterranei]